MGNTTSNLGMSLKPHLIYINGNREVYKNDWISFETIASKSGKKNATTVTYSSEAGDNGELRPGNIKVLTKGLRFEVGEG